MSFLDPLRNLLLAGLPPEDMAHLNNALEPVTFTQNEPLYRANQPLSHAFFIVRGMVSMVRTTGEGATVEVGPVGRDGMIGVPIFLDAATDPLDAFAQILPCEALHTRRRLPPRLRAAARFTERDEPLHVLDLHGHGAMGRLRAPPRAGGTPGALATDVSRSTRR